MIDKKTESARNASVVKSINMCPWLGTRQLAEAAGMEQLSVDAGKKDREEDAT